MTSKRKPFVLSRRDEKHVNKNVIRTILDRFSGNTNCKKTTTKNNEIINTKVMCPKKQLLRTLLTRFYDKSYNIAQLMEYILQVDEKTGKQITVNDPKENTKRKRIPIRIINWFVTNYAKKYNSHYVIKWPGNRRQTFYVHSSYKSQLDAYSKEMFDAFRRGKRVVVESDHPDYPVFTTTIAQLSFFRWAIENKVLDYVKKHLKEIENDLKYSVKNNNDKNNNSQKRELSVSATKTLYCNKCQVTVKFTHV